MTPWTVKQDAEGAWQISDPEGKPQGRYLNAHELATYLAAALCGAREIEAENKRLRVVMARYPEIESMAIKLHKQLASSPLFVRRTLATIANLASLGSIEAAEAASPDAAPVSTPLPSAASAV